MSLNDKFIIIIYIFGFVLMNCFFSSFTINVDEIKKVEQSQVRFDTIPYVVNDIYFIQAYDEISRMLDGKDSLSIKKNRLVLKKNALKNDDL